MKEHPHLVEQRLDDNTLVRSARQSCKAVVPLAPEFRLSLPLLSASENAELEREAECRAAQTEIARVSADEAVAEPEADPKGLQYVQRDARFRLGHEETIEVVTGSLVTIAVVLDAPATSRPVGVERWLRIVSRII